MGRFAWHVYFLPESTALEHRVESVASVRKLPPLDPRRAACIDAIFNVARVEVN